MRALIIGGVGGMGQGVAKYLVWDDRVTDVILADLYPDPERLTPKLRENKKATLVKMDVNEHDAMVAAFKEVDIVINTAGPFYKTAVPVARAAVEAKVNYIDICDDYEGTEILFNLSGLLISGNNSSRSAKFNNLIDSVKDKGQGVISD